MSSFLCSGLKKRQSSYCDFIRSGNSNADEETCQGVVMARDPRDLVSDYTCNKCSQIYTCGLVSGLTQELSDMLEMTGHHDACGLEFLLQVYFS